MKLYITHNNRHYSCNLNRPIDISIPMNLKSVVAWDMPSISISPVKINNWTADVSQGAAVNFNTIVFNPHAHGTHTECVGHISPNKESLNQELNNFFFISKLISICPKKKNKDRVITKKMIQELVKKEDKINTLVIRTFPNTKQKLSKNYTNTNPPYLLKDAIDYMVGLGVKHLLIDLPSVDKEKDGGKILGHKSFWGYPSRKRKGCTITELIFVKNSIKDGYYLLNLQFVPFENDASPSRPLLFKFEKSV